MKETPASAEKVARFRALHEKGAAFLIPNFWDAGSAKVLESLGFDALASTSVGFALTKGRPDYGVTRDEAMAHAREICAAVSVPVSADLENGFGLTPEDCAETIRQAAQSGLCGGSIEDTTGEANRPIHDLAAAVDRINAAVEAARAAPSGFVLTARADGYLWGAADLDEIIRRLQAFEEAGADVLYAPGLPDMAAVEALCSSVSKPVNVLLYGALANHAVGDFAKAGAARLSFGGTFAFSAYGALVELATAVKDGGALGALNERRQAMKFVRSAVGR